MKYHSEVLLGTSAKEILAEREIHIRETFVRPGKIYHIVKRSFDLFFSLLFTLFVLSWLVPILGLLIVLESKGPVFFGQWRLGKNGRTFRCLKFRTMILNDEANEKQASKNDYRITKLGRFLRRTNIDEFPQFINVLVGDMSIIGPRPHMLSDCTRFSFVIPAYRFRTQVRPGITGLAQVKGHYGPTLNYESIFLRYHWDAEYIRNAGILLDLKIIFLTLIHGLSNLIHLCGSMITTQKI